MIFYHYGASDNVFKHHIYDVCSRIYTISTRKFMGIMSKNIRKTWAHETKILVPSERGDSWTLQICYSFTWKFPRWDIYSRRYIMDMMFKHVIWCPVMIEYHLHHFWKLFEKLFFSKIFHQNPTRKFWSICQNRLFSKNVWSWGGVRRKSNGAVYVN